MSSLLLFVPSIILLAMFSNGLLAGELGNCSRRQIPSSQAFIRLGSIGKLPRYGTLNRAAMVTGVFVEVELEGVKRGVFIAI